MLDLTQLRSFVAVEQMGSFTFAAERLGLGQSTVSQRIMVNDADDIRRVIIGVRHRINGRYGFG